MHKTAVVVGSGAGGLAAAIRLAALGYGVEVWEKNAAPGGKLQEWRAEGYRFDTGPSLLTMPDVVRDLFAAAGARAEDYLTFERLPVGCRYFWRDGTVIDEDEAFWARPEVAAFLRHAEGIYALSGEAYLTRPPAEFWKAFSWRNLPQLRHLPKVATLRTLAADVERRFADPHLRQLFQRFATYNGSSPYKTPATFNIIPYVEARFGAWYVKGGMARLADALLKLAQEKGVVVRTETEAKSWRNGEIESADGRRARPDVLVCNQDVLAAAQGWLAESYSKGEREALLKPELSCSGFVLFLGVREKYPQLSHHNIFFSDDYPAEFAALWHKKQPHLAPDPTLYVAATSRTDPDHAPSGCDNWFVLANAPALAPGTLSARDTEVYADAIVARLEASGMPGLSGKIAVRRAFTCHDFAARDGSHRGSLYGWASHTLRTSLLRPPLWRRKPDNLYFVGGTTHPGGGIPLVLLSAKMVAERVAARDGAPLSR
jgi:phytoene desaturase